MVPFVRMVPWALLESCSKLLKVVERCSPKQYGKKKKGNPRSGSPSLERLNLRSSLRSHRVPPCNQHLPSFRKGLPPAILGGKGVSAAGHRYPFRPLSRFPQFSPIFRDWESCDCAPVISRRACARACAGAPEVNVARPCRCARREGGMESEDRNPPPPPPWWRR